VDISNWIERWADFTPDKTAIRFMGVDITYLALRDRVRRAAAMLRDECNIGRGDRIAFLGYNSPDMLALLFACARLGAMLVPLNWRLAPPEHAYILNHAGVTAVFAEPDFIAGIDAIRDAVPARRCVAMADVAPGWDAFDGLMQSTGGDARDDAAGLDDPLLLVYTSGTTGRPKGAVLSQGALTFNAVNAIAAFDMTSGELNIQTTPALNAGATVVLHARFDLDATLTAIGDERPSLTVLVPAQIAAAMQHPDWPRLDLSCLRCLGTGSTIVPGSQVRALLDRGVPVVQVYGLTETAPIVIHQRIADAWSTAGSVGKAALHCRARIVGADGAELPPGDKGEIVVQGANVTAGYWNDPAASAAAIKDGWFHTGDIGHRDANGSFHVDDRLKDVIISGGENVYPAELEAVLDDCPDIAEAAVVGAPDDRWGETPVAFVVRHPGSAITEDGVRALFVDRLARFKHPHRVVFTDSLPRNAMGKVLKFELRALV
jgi:fatty-acyl-CoA synthase